ncbi:hypothetical protein F2Q68_00019600, partial [Brassica cretica]
FLLEHGYINFGLAPVIKEAKLRSFDGLEPPNVVVVGAGLAGLVAARQLLSMGFRVLVLEGRDRPGGRVKTRKMKGGDGVEAMADVGGSVLTGINGNPLGVLARQLGLPLHKVRDICPLYLPSGDLVDVGVDSKIEASFNKLLDRVCKLRQSMIEEIKSVDVPLGEALETFRLVYGVAEDHEERMLFDWHLANLEYANATLLGNLSMAYWDQDDPYEMGGDHCFIPGGNETFVHALAENLPVFYGNVVESIRYGSDGVVVYAGDKEFSCDMALCTVPLGVLKKGGIGFVPELPEKKKEAIQRLGYGLLNKVAMLFPYNFWGEEIDTFGRLTEVSSTRGEFFLFYSYSSVSGGPLLVALVAGDAAERFETMSPTDSVKRVLQILRGIYHPKGIVVPDPVQALCSRWGQDKFSYGSYSYVAVGSSGDDYDILAESVGDGRVFFAGEATNKQYPATMHGAFLSGMREAANILRVARRRASESASNLAKLTEVSSTRGEFFLFYSYSSVSGGPLLVALVAGDAAERFETMSPTDSVKRVLQILRGIYHPKGIVVPDPVQALCSRWGQDKFSYGSYSYVAVGSSGDDYDILAESVGDGRVFFAGEATNKQYPATMHGAFLSGMREAANILRVARRRASESASNLAK